METINGLYKAECIRTTVFHQGPYKTIADVEYASHRLGRLVQRQTSARHPGKHATHRVRASPLRCSQPRAAPRIGTAENLERFSVDETDLDKSYSPCSEGHSRVPTRYRAQSSPVDRG